METRAIWYSIRRGKTLGGAADRKRIVKELLAMLDGERGVPVISAVVVEEVEVALQGRPQPYTSLGPPADLMLNEPDVLAYDHLDLGGTGTAYGSNLATPLAAGLAACVLGSGVSPEAFVHFVRSTPRAVLRTP